MALETASLTLRLVGVRPILLHNSLPFLTPDNPMLREMKKISAKQAKSKTDDDHARMSELEFMMGLYTDENGGIIIPSQNIEAVLRAGATAERKGKLVQAAVTIVDDSPLLDAKGTQYRDPDKLWSSGKHAHRAVCAVQKSRVLRTRPIFHQWQLMTTMLYLPSQVNKADIVQAMTYAGILKGLGDWRPRFGSFTVDVC